MRPPLARTGNIPQLGKICRPKKVTSRAGIRKIQDVGMIKNLRV